MRLLNFKSKRLSLLSCALLACLPLAAHATTYSNTESSTISSFGTQDWNNWGETFVAPGQALQSWQFTLYTNSTSPSNVLFEVASWNGSYALSPVLYTSAPTSVQIGLSGYQAVTFSNINLNLVQGNSYVAFMSVDGVSNPLNGSTLETSSSNAGLGGQEVFAGQSGQSVFNGSAWGNYNGTYFGTGSEQSLQFSATFGSASTASSVPAPQSIYLALLGLSGLILVKRKRLG